MSWKVKFLGDVCEIINGSTPLRSNKDFWENGQFPWFTIDDIRQQGRIINHTKQKVTEKALSKLRILPKDSVLLCCTASVGEYAITNIEITTNQQFNGLVVKNKKELNPIYLMHYCSILKDKLLNLSGKTTIDFIAISKLKNLEIPLPPLSEQQAIVEKLDAAFALIDQAKANIEKNVQNAKELFQSKLNQIFSQKGEGWEERKLGEVCIIKPPKKEAKEVVGVEDLVTFLPMEDLGICAKETTPNKARKLKEVSGSYTYFKEGDILLAKITPCFENGKLSIARNLVNKIGFGSSEYVVFRTNKELLNEYLFYFLSRDTFRAEGKRKMQGAVGHKRISKEFIEDALIYLPSLQTQQEIVSQLDALSEQTKQLEAKYQTKLGNLEELRKSILEKAFKGELVQMSESQISTD